MSVSIPSKEHVESSLNHIFFVVAHLIFVVCNLVVVIIDSEIAFQLQRSAKLKIERS